MKAKKRSQISTAIPWKSITEIPDFPFETFQDFASSYREGRVQVWTSYRSDAQKILFGPASRIAQGIALYSGAWIALIFAVCAAAAHNLWMALAIPAALLAFVTADRNFNLVQGCLSCLFALVSVGLGMALGKHELFIAGGAGAAAWVITSIGLAVADMALRDAMLESEARFLRLCALGAVGAVSKIPAS